MEHLVALAPILGSYDRDQSVFGFPGAPRYARGMTEKTLDWQDENRGSVAILAPMGRVDESTADAFKDHLLSAVEKKPSVVVIDLDGVAYMSSRGLRALTLAQRACQGTDTTVILARPNETMREILAISRYDMVFQVVDTIEAATGN